MADAARELRIATRRSQLALTQTTMVRRALEQRSGVRSGVQEVVTSGDKKQGAPESTPRDKKDWILEIEQALLSGEADIAVHSGKDVPLTIEAGTTLVPILERANPFDLFIPKQGSSPSQTAAEALAALPAGAVIGTSSVRRRAQLLHLRPDLQVVPLRGNVPTRLQKLADQPELAAIVLATAGMERLGLLKPHHLEFAPEDLLPAVHQGTLVAQLSAERTDLLNLLAPLVDPKTEASWRAERACIEQLNADCNSALGVYAKAAGENVIIVARVLSSDGAVMLQAQADSAGSTPEAAGRAVAASLLAQGAANYL